MAKEFMLALQKSAYESTARSIRPSRSMLGVDKSLRMRKDIRLVYIKVLVLTLDALLALWRYLVVTITIQQAIYWYLLVRTERVAPVRLL